MSLNRSINATWVGDYPPWDRLTTAPDISSPTMPWDTTGGRIAPYTTPNTTVTWPPPGEPHPAELESFEEFVIWACGFTDPDHPPSKRKWEEFQKRVQQLAADFVEYKRAKRERERLSPPFAVSSGVASTNTF